MDRKDGGMDRNDVSDFLLEKEAKSECPCCGKNEWFIGQTEAEFSSQIRLMREDELLLPTVILVCTNCGFIKQHAKLYIERWVGRRTDGK